MIDPVQYFSQCEEITISIFSFLDFKSIKSCSYVSRNWNRITDDHQLWKNLLTSRDRFTTYDYALGEMRRKWVKERQVQFKVLLGLSWERRPFSHFVPQHLSVYISASVNSPLKLNFLPANTANHFIIENIKNFGRKYAEAILSSTASGSLYWHMIYHHQSYENFLESHKQIEKRNDEPPTKKRRV